MVHIKFKYCDPWSTPSWNTQECIVKDVKECIRIYGLDDHDVEYEIISVEEIKES